MSDYPAISFDLTPGEIEAAHEKLDLDWSEARLLSSADPEDDVTYTGYARVRRALSPATE